MGILTVIPARMAASRLPGKPLADIHGMPMIVHVWQRAMAAELGPVLVATDSKPIADAIAAVGGRAVMTSPDHPSGSDRIWEAVQTFDPEGQNEAVLNLQGDLPTIDAATVQACATVQSLTGADIATLAAEITDDAEHSDPNVVKVVGAEYRVDGATPAITGCLRALYFTRATAPAGPGPRYHHIGIYLYRRAALERFVSLPPSALERRERLEQLRALEAEMRIGVGIVASVPRGVDTPQDLAWARGALAP